MEIIISWSKEKKWKGFVGDGVADCLHMSFD